LDQNARSYLQINDMVLMGEEMVKAGLTVPKISGRAAVTQQEEGVEESTAEKRIVSFCINAALAEDDFETAYSYVTTRLATVAAPAQAQSEKPKSKRTGLEVGRPPAILDDWSWKAALEVYLYSTIQSSC
jgi:hypothetical protein